MEQTELPTHLIHHTFTEYLTINTRIQPFD